MAFLAQPHSSLTTPTSIMLEVCEEPCPLRTARVFGLQWATSLPGERVVHCRWRPQSEAIKEFSGFQLYTNSSVYREECDPCSSSRSDKLLRAQTPAKKSSYHFMAVHVMVKSQEAMILGNLSQILTIQKKQLTISINQIPSLHTNYMQTFLKDWYLNHLKI